MVEVKKEESNLWVHELLFTEIRFAQFSSGSVLSTIFGDIKSILSFTLMKWVSETF